MSSVHEEHLILLGAIISDRFLRQLVSLDPLPLIDNRLLKSVLGMCCAYFQQQQSAPGLHIRDIWRIERQDSDEDEAKLELVDKTIERVLSEYDAGRIQFNVEYVLGLAEQYLKLRKLKRMADDLRVAVTNKDPDVADQVIVKYMPLRLNGGGGSTPVEGGFFTELFESEERPLFELSGPLGQVMNRQFFRSGFISFFGPAKVGKSWTLMEMAMQAWWQRCNVAYFVVGDMSLRDVKERMASHMTRRPSRRFAKRISLVNVPKMNGSGVEHEQQTIDPFGMEDIAKAERLWKIRTRGKHLRVDCFPGMTKSIRDLDARLAEWEHFHKFMADVVVIDYADVLMPMQSRGDGGERNEINDTWIYMRALAQKRNNLVITATQADAGSYRKKRLDMSNFSGDRRKNDHVTALYALTQSREDKVADRIVVEEILVRHGQSADSPVTVHRCLPMGRFNVFGTWGVIGRQDE